MDVIQNVFERAESGDRIMISFPDMVSFYTVIRWLTAHYGEPLWILWTDAAVERINFLGRKFGYPLEGRAVLIGARKECDFLDVIAKYELYDELGSAVKTVPAGGTLLVSFGINFLKYFGERVSKAVEMIIEHENGILCTCVIGEPPEELLGGHRLISHLPLVRCKAEICH